MMRLIQKLDKFDTNNQKIDQISKFDSTYLRGDQEGLFKLVTLDRILNRITGVMPGTHLLHATRYHATLRYATEMCADI
jgi:hypothetical protein